MTRGLWKKSNQQRNNEVSKKDRQRKKSGSESATDTEQLSVEPDSISGSLNNNIEFFTEPKVESSTLERTAKVKILSTGDNNKTGEPSPLQQSEKQRDTKLSKKNSASETKQDSTLERTAKSKKPTTEKEATKTSTLERTAKSKKPTTEKEATKTSTLERTAKSKKPITEKEATKTSTLERTAKSKKPITEKEATKTLTLERTPKSKKQSNEKESKQSAEKTTKTSTLERNKKKNAEKPVAKSTKSKKNLTRESGEENSTDVISLGKLPSVVDSKHLPRDELFDFLQSATEESPSNLKVTIIRSYVAIASTDITVKKNDVVFVLLKQKELLYVRNKKGAKGFIPFVCTSCSVEEQPKKKTSRKFRRKSVDSVTNEIEKLKKFDSAQTNTTTAKEKPVPTEIIPLRDHSSTKTGSPLIQHRSIELQHCSIEILSDVETLIKHQEEKASSNNKTRKNKEDKHNINRSRSKSVDLLLNERQNFDSVEDVYRERELERPSTSLDRPDSSFDTGFTSDFSEISKDSSLERILSPFTRKKFNKNSIKVTSTDKEMNKLKFFSRNKNKASKEKLSARNSDSSTKISDSELSSTSTSKIVKKNNKKNSGPPARPRTSSQNSQQQFDWYSNLFTDNVSSDSSDSEDDSTTTDNESIRVYQKKSSSIKADSIFDYERFRSLDRSKTRRSSDTSASSEFYVPQRITPKTTLHEENNTNDKRLTKSSGGFAQIHKTNTIQSKKKMKSSSDTLLPENNNANIENTTTTRANVNNNNSDDNTALPTTNANNLDNSNNTANSIIPTTNLKKNRLSSSNNSLRSSTKVKRKGYLSDNEVERLHSPLKSTKSIEPVTEPLKDKIVKSFQNETNLIPVRQSVAIDNANNNNNNKMIVSYDFIASEESDITILTGQQVEVLRKPDIDWWWVRAADGREGFAPSTFLAQIPTVPSRKPDLLKKLNSSPVNDINNNLSGIEAKTAVNLPFSTQLSRDTLKLAKVAPLIRDDVSISATIDDITLYKKMQMYGGGGMENIRPITPAPPSYNQHMMTRQKSDLSDNYHVNKRQYLAECQHKQGVSKNWKSQEHVMLPVEATHDPGGASRIVRRRSFSGRQKKVRFANDISSNDEQTFQNSPGQILIIRQTNSAMGHYSRENTPYSTQHADDQEVEIATWC